MKVTMLTCTPYAPQVLTFTKSTRLNMDVGAWEKARDTPTINLLGELGYMADTIPSSWEFVDYVFLIEGVSRAFTHQFVRNRHGSYAQQSLRVVSLDAGYDFVMPERIAASERATEIVNGVNDHIHAAYRELTGLGIPTEDARSILPTNVATNIACKFNLRTLSELAKSRTGGRTQGEYQGVMKALTAAVLSEHPWAATFLFPMERDYFDAIEAFAERKFGGDLIAKGELLKIVDKMRKEFKR